MTAGARDQRPAAERADVLLAVAAGGAVGSLARYALSLVFPHHDGGFPVATLLVNVIGCLLIGVLMATITEVGRPHRLLRPFFGVGVLGGFTTFSTYVFDVIDTGTAGAAVVAVVYGVGTVVASIGATMAGLVATRALLRPRRARGEHP